MNSSTVDNSSIGIISSFAIDKADTAGFMCTCIGDGPNTFGEIFKLGGAVVVVIQSGGTGGLSDAEGLTKPFKNL